MVSRKEKVRALEFLAEMLKRSQKYTIGELDPEHILATTEISDKKLSISVILANYQGSSRDYLHQVAQNAQRGIFTCPILYKDGKTAFARMVDNNLSWRTDRSLKQYSSQEVNSMISLRKIEKEVLEQFGEEVLSYYQPSQERLEETLRRISLGEVVLDYSHIGPGDQGYGFVEDRPSIDYKIPEQVSSSNDAAEFIGTKNRKDQRIVSIVPIIRES